MKSNNPEICIWINLKELIIENPKIEGFKDLDGKGIVFKWSIFGDVPF